MTGVNYVTLTGTIPWAGGAVLSAVLSGWVPDATDELLFPPAPQPVTLANATVNGIPCGTFSLPLLANDNANIPAGTYWMVSLEGIAGVASFEQSYTLNHAAGATQDISALAVYTPPAAVTPVMPLPSGTPLAGQVPQATGSGSASAWGQLSGAYLCAPVVYSTAEQPSTVSTSLVAVDSTHLVVTFTAPPSGKATVRLSGVPHNSGANAYWGLLNASGETQVGIKALVSNALASYPQISIPVVVTGLTPGTSYTLQWAHSTSLASAATTLNIDSGTTFGAATMEVQAI